MDRKVSMEDEKLPVRLGRVLAYLVMLGIGLFMYAAVGADVGHGPPNEIAAVAGHDTDTNGLVFRFGDSAARSLAGFVKLSASFFASFLIIGGFLGLLFSVVETSFALVARLPDTYPVSGAVASWSRRAGRQLGTMLESDRGITESAIGRLAIAAVTAIAVTLSISATVKLDRRVVGLDPKDARVISDNFERLGERVSTLTKQIREASETNKGLSESLVSLDLEHLDESMRALEARLGEWRFAEARDAVLEASSALKKVDQSLRTTSKRISDATTSVDTMSGELRATNTKLAEVDTKLAKQLRLETAMQASLHDLEIFGEKDESRHLFQRVGVTLFGAQRSVDVDVATPPPQGKQP